MRVRSLESVDGLAIAVCVEGSVEVSSEAVAGFVHDACEKPW